METIQSYLVFLPVSSPSLPSMAASTTDRRAREVPLFNLLAGAWAGAAETAALHPIDTIKTRLQLQHAEQTHYGGMLHCGTTIAREEGLLALYKGLTPVMAGIIPKIAIRFTAFEYYKSVLRRNNPPGEKETRSQTFLAGLLTGITEAVLIVTPMELLKIRLQAQRGSTELKYRGQYHAIKVILHEEGIAGLYRGLWPTIWRQGSNEAVKFTLYNAIREKLIAQNKGKLATWHPTVAGLSAGFIGAFLNSPVDVVKTRLQRQVVGSSKARYRGFFHAVGLMWREEGASCFFKGVVPRVIRIGLGHAVIFTVYEGVMHLLDAYLARRREALRSTHDQ